MLSRRAPPADVSLATKKLCAVALIALIQGDSLISGSAEHEAILRRPVPEARLKYHYDAKMKGRRPTFGYSNLVHEGWEDVGRVQFEVIVWSV